MIIRSEKEREALREGGKILARIMSEIEVAIEPGTNTQQLDELAERLVFSYGGKPSFKGYPASSGKLFPATICASVNSEVVHGIPSPEKILKKGDILKVDIGMEYKGLITDMARTFSIGEVSQETKKLINVTRESLYQGIGSIRSDATINDFAKSVQTHVEKNGFSVIRDLVGHGVGKRLHEEPSVPNYVSQEGKFVFQNDMVLALEPMVNIGDWKVKLSSDGWTFVTRDGSLSAHFEDTIIVGDKTSEIITKL